MATNPQVCSGVYRHPSGAGIWLIQFWISWSLTWQGDGATEDSSFLYDFSIRLILATFIGFRVTISHFPSPFYSLSAAKSLSSRARLFFFHCDGSSLLNFLSAKFRSLLNHCIFLCSHAGSYSVPFVYIHRSLPPLALFSLLLFLLLVLWLPPPPPLSLLIPSPPLLLSPPSSLLPSLIANPVYSLAEGGERL